MGYGAKKTSRLRWGEMDNQKMAKATKSEVKNEEENEQRLWNINGSSGEEANTG